VKKQRQQPEKRNDHDAAPAARATHEVAPLPAKQVTRGDGTGDTT